MARAFFYSLWSVTNLQDTSEKSVRMNLLESVYVVVCMLWCDS